VLKAPVAEAVDRVAVLVDDRQEAGARPGGGPQEAGHGRRRRGAPMTFQEFGGVRLMAKVLPGIDARDLKGLADEGKKRIGSGVIALVGVSEDGKAGLVVAVTDDLKARVNAVDLVRKGAEPLGGKGGGGRPDMAQAGGPNGAGAEAALAAVSQALSGTVRGGEMPRRPHQISVWRRRVYQILDSGVAGDAIQPTPAHGMLIVLVVLNVIGRGAGIGSRDLPQVMRQVFVVIETLSVTIFTIEYVARLWVAPEHWSAGQPFSALESTASSTRSRPG
jgi:hypothetical protein